MIKALARTEENGREKVILLLGLSQENWRRMRANNPVLVKLTPLDPSSPVHELLLVAGKTEGDLMNALQSVIGPETDIQVSGGPIPGADA